MGDPKLEFHPEAPPATALRAENRFAAEVAKESAAFDVAYAVAEGVWVGVVTLLVVAEVRLPFEEGNYASNTETNARMTNSLMIVRTYPFFVPFIVLVRICRARCEAQSSRVTSVLGTCFETVSLTLSSCFSCTMLSPFMLTTTLSYMLIFVLPYRRGLVVVPLSFLTYLELFDHDLRTSTWGDIAALGFGLCLNLAAKRLIERSKWQAFQALDEKSKQALDEKILRFQAEFAQETAASSGHCHIGNEESTYLNGSCASDAGRTSACRPAKPAVSMHSAPTILEASAGSHATVCLGADCLPPDASVWVEGSALPQPLQGLETGARILCFDRLGGGVKYVPASAVHTEAASLTWTDVRLDSGAVLTMTADHPVQPVAPDPSNQPFSVPPVRAAELRPGVDSLLTLNTAPCLVQCVTSYEAEGARVSLAVPQPERHTIFVAARAADAGGGSLAYSQPLAVESADLTTHPRGGHIKVLEKGTFLHCEDRAHAPKRLSVSAPPSLGCGGRGGCPADSWQLPELSPSDSSSVLSSGSAEVIVGWRLPGSQGEAEQPDARSPLPVRVSDVLRVLRRGLRSWGSSQHAGGGCKPCAFENRRQFSGGKGCSKGVLCERCHEHHDRNMKQDTRRKRRDLRASERKSKRGNSSCKAAAGVGSDARV